MSVFIEIGEKNMGISQYTDEDISRMLDKITFPKLPYRSVRKDYSEETLNHKICEECKGECCKRCGCYISPDEFEEISFDALKKEIEKGYISIEGVDGEIIYSDFYYYILRVRNKDTPIVDESFIGRNECILLSETGCRLSDDKRPAGGRLMVPKKREERRKWGCPSKYSLKECCYEWKPHKKVLYELRKYFENKDFPCLL